jgi:hypothetical protein
MLGLAANARSAATRPLRSVDREGLRRGERSGDAPAMGAGYVNVIDLTPDAPVASKKRRRR